MIIMKIISKLGIIVRTLISYIGGAILCIVLGLPILLLLLLPDRYRYDNVLLFRLLHMFYKGIIKCTFMPLHVQGQENMPTIPAIIVANHQSSLDIPLVGSMMHGFPHTWYVLSYYLRYPILGWFIRRMCISLDRDDAAKAAQGLIRGMRLVEGKKNHIIIFPEGGRFNDGKIHNFLLGFAVMARVLKRPVVPLLLQGTGTVHPPESFLVYPGELTLRVGPHFVYEEGETDSNFVERIYQWFTTQN